MTCTPAKDAQVAVVAAAIEQNGPPMRSAGISLGPQLAVSVSLVADCSWSGGGREGLIRPDSRSAGVLVERSGYQAAGSVAVAG